MATTYNYRYNVCEDIRNYIEENSIKVTADNRQDLYNDLYDDLFISDSVTGNASGSYTFSTYQAEENLCHNFDLLADALSEFGYYNDENILQKGAEWCDVIIRCYLLSECLSIVLDELEEEEEEEEEEETTEE